MSLAAGSPPHSSSEVRSTIAYVAGRSGGHILPALTHAQTHLAGHPTDRILFISTDTKLDVAILSAAPQVHTMVHLRLTNIPRSLFALPVFFVRCGVAFVKSFLLLRKHRVTELVSMGGYISVPVCLAARCLRIPVILFELNAEPGRATRFLAPWVTKVAICFEHAARFFRPGITHHVAYPLRYQQQPACAEVAQHMFAHGLTCTKKTVLVLGGSQGSVFLNNSMGSWFDAMPQASEQVQIVHQTGEQDSCNWQAWYRERGIAAVVFAYADDLSLWYAAADLIVCRAGAGTLFEVAFFNKRCLIVPLVTGETSHQVDNARAMVARYPELFSMLDQATIERDPMVLFLRLQRELS